MFKKSRKSKKPASSLSSSEDSFKVVKRKEDIERGYFDEKSLSLRAQYSHNHALWHSKLFKDDVSSDSDQSDTEQHYEDFRGKITFDFEVSREKRTKKKARRDCKTGAWNEKYGNALVVDRLSEEIEDERIMLVCYDFDAVQNNDLTIRMGQRVRVVDFKDQDWWWVRRPVDGAEGYVPCNFLIDVPRIPTRQNRTRTSQTSLDENNNKTTTEKNIKSDNKQLTNSKLTIDAGNLALDKMITSSCDFKEAKIAPIIRTGLNKLASETDVRINQLKEELRRVKTTQSTPSLTQEENVKNTNGNLSKITNETTTATVHRTHTPQRPSILRERSCEGKFSSILRPRENSLEHAMDSQTLDRVKRERRRSFSGRLKKVRFVETESEMRANESDVQTSEYGDFMECATWC